MAIRNNKIVFTFDAASPRITAHGINEWLHAEIRIQEQKVQMIQIDGIKRQVYVKLRYKEYIMSIINDKGSTNTTQGKSSQWR
jgi:predicted polyphosphate/ATP-dependent NAD kinase